MAQAQPTSSQSSPQPKAQPQSAPDASDGADDSEASEDGGGEGEKKESHCCWWIIGGIILANVIPIIVVLSLLGTFKGSGFGMDWIRGTGSGDCTSAILSQATVNAINANKTVYQSAAQKAGIPWELLAAIHYRETALSTTSSNPFQHGHLTFSSFQAAADDAALFVKDSAKKVYGVNLKPSSTGEDIKKAALSYNRWSLYKVNGCAVDSSPYVMNNYDDAYKDMRWPNSACEDGNKVKGEIDEKAGAFTVFSILKGDIAGSGNCGQTGGSVVPGGCGGVIENAKNYLNRSIYYQQRNPHCGNSKTTGPNGVGWLDCSGYLSRVFHDAGITTKNWCFTTATLPAQGQFALVTNSRAIARQILAPGDLILITGHVVMYGGLENGKMIIYESTPGGSLWRVINGGGPIKRLYKDYFARYGNRFRGVYRAKTCGATTSLGPKQRNISASEIIKQVLSFNEMRWI